MACRIPDIPFREYQVNALASFVDSDPTLSPPNLFLQGYSGTGKTFTVNKFFEANPQLIHASLKPAESVTWKPLIQSIARIIQFKCIQLFPDIKMLRTMDPLAVEEPYHLVTFINKIVQIIPNLDCFYLIFDGLDELQDIDATLLFKFIKLNELISNNNSKFNLKMIYLVSDSAFIQRYATFNLPTIVFQRYNYHEILQILLVMRYADLTDDLNIASTHRHQFDMLDEQTTASIVINFITLIVQAFHMYAGNNINTLNDLIDLKWDSYLANINNSNCKNTVALYRQTITLFNSTNDTFTEDDAPETVPSTQIKEQTYELSKISKYLLIAAYFCSYIEPKYDASIFSKKTHIKTGRVSYGRRKPRDFNPRHLQPSIFFLERLFAVFQSIFPMEHQTQSGSLAALLDENLMSTNIEVFQNLAELHVLKLISTTTSKNIDFLSYKVKWKVNVPWGIIQEIAASVQFDITQYFSGLDDF